jgi:ribosomal protein L28
MAKISIITGKTHSTGFYIKGKGQSKKSDGIDIRVAKQTERLFKPDLQHTCIFLPSGHVKRAWVVVKAIKTGFV